MPYVLITLLSWTGILIFMTYSHASYLHCYTPYLVNVLIVVEVRLFYFNQFSIMAFLLLGKFSTLLISDLVNTTMRGLFLNNGRNVPYNLICYSIEYPHCSDGSIKYKTQLFKWAKAVTDCIYIVFIYSSWWSNTPGESITWNLVVLYSECPTYNAFVVKG